jgi:hypothetical protein
MMNMRHGNTAREMVESGQWAKIGRKHYRHESGAEILYNNNRWLWEVVGASDGWSALWVARHWVEKGFYASAK